MFDRSWCKSNFFPSKISNSYRKYRFEKIFLLYHSSQKFNFVRVRIRRRNTTLDASFIWKFKNIFEELSFDFPFLQFAIHPPRRSKEQRGNKNWKILGAHRQSFDRGPLLPTFSPAAAPIASSLEPGKFSFPANHRKIPFQDLVSLRSSA